MKKIIITESQYRTIRKYLLESGLSSYSLDWDDNILRMPTKIKMDKKTNDKWVPLEVSTEEFAHVRNDPNYRVRNNNFSEAFVDFRDDKKFEEDVKYAINHNDFAPSYEDFIQALINVEHFAINTARGHSPYAIRKGVKIFIDKVFTDDQKKMMYSNLKKELPQGLTKTLNFSQLIDLYFDERGGFYPVSSEEFGKQFGLEVSGGAANPEHAKKVALEDKIKKYLNDPKTKNALKKGVDVSFGFSDDDKKNVKASEDFFENELSLMYPEIYFAVYDTSGGGKKETFFKNGKKINYKPKGLNLNVSV